MYAVIMASGQGSRLWPLSRQSKPKQFHSFIGDKSLIQETYKRLRLKLPIDKIIITVTSDYLEEAKKQLPDVPADNFIVEPFAVSTSASIGMALFALKKRAPEEYALIVPSDHIITEPQKFIDTVQFAEDEIIKHPENVILIGINPTRPDTAMGYIQMDSQLETKGDFKLFSVKKFVEKPNLETAEQYVTSWDFLWNAGMFAWKISTILAMYEKFIPKTAQLLEEFSHETDSKKIAAKYKELESNSIDYSVIEKADNIMVIPANFGWSDVGSWDALTEVLTEHFGAKMISKGNHISIDDDKCLVLAGEKLIATVGLQNIVIVDTPDALLVCNSNEAQKVKELILKLKNEGKNLYL